MKKFIFSAFCLLILPSFSYASNNLPINLIDNQNWEIEVQSPANFDLNIQEIFNVTRDGENFSVTGYEIDLKTGEKEKLTDTYFVEFMKQYIEPKDDYLEIRYCWYKYKYIKEGFACHYTRIPTIINQEQVKGDDSYSTLMKWAGDEIEVKVLKKSKKEIECNVRGETYKSEKIYHTKASTEFSKLNQYICFESETEAKNSGYRLSSLGGGSKLEVENVIQKTEDSTDILLNKSDLQELTYTKLFQKVGEFKVRIKDLETNKRDLFQLFLQDRYAREIKNHYEITIKPSAGNEFVKESIKGNMIYEFKSGLFYTIKIAAFDNSNNLIAEETFSFDKTNDKKSYQVTSITDGDTFKINIDGETETVRIIGIDTPELSPKECFAEDAKEKLKNLIGGENVFLEPGSGSDNKDYYGRLLRYVYDANSNDVGASMIKEGYAYSYEKYPHEKLSEYESFEAEAKEDLKGLWNDDNCQVSTENFNKEDCNCNKPCSEMTSCEEAYFYLEVCGCSEKDRDKDGVPCESVCGE